MVGKRYPETIGNLLLSDLASSANLLRASQPPEDVSVPQVEDPESASLWEPIWGVPSLCCQHTPALSRTTTPPLVETPPRVSTARVHRTSSLRRERIPAPATASWTVNSLPEPLYMLLLGSGLFCLGILRNRAKKA